MDLSQLGVARSRWSASASVTHIYRQVSAYRRITLCGRSTLGWETDTTALPSIEHADCKVCRQVLARLKEEI